MTGFGECLPYRENTALLDPQQIDKWGMPVLRIDCSWGENELAMRLDMRTQAAEMLEAAGCRSQLHDAPNVYVTDGACMTSSACQNPSITYMALTARAVEHAVRARQRRDA